MVGAQASEKVGTSRYLDSKGGTAPSGRKCSTDTDGQGKVCAAEEAGASWLLLLALEKRKSAPSAFFFQSASSTFQQQNPAGGWQAKEPVKRNLQSSRPRVTQQYRKVGLWLRGDDE